LGGSLSGEFTGMWGQRERQARSRCSWPAARVQQGSGDSLLHAPR